MISCLLLNSGLTILFAILFAISEYIGTNPKMKQNTVYQVIHSFLIAATKNSKEKEK